MKRMETGNNSLSDLIGTPEENENNDTNMQQIAKDQVDAFFSGMGRPQPVTESKPSESITIQQVKFIRSLHQEKKYDLKTVSQ